METLNVKFYNGQTVILNSNNSAEEDIFVSFFRNLGTKGMATIRDAYISFPSFDACVLIENGLINSSMLDIVECC